MYSSQPKRKGAYRQHIRITRVTWGQQPKAIVKAVTRTGKPKRDSRYGITSFRVWLRWDGKGWTMPPGYEQREE